MIAVDFAGAAVIVTGGTRGLGKAIGQAFARAGAHVVLTHRWGSVDEEELVAEFLAAQLPPPSIVESDVSDPEAARELMRYVKDQGHRLDVVVSNVAFAKVVHDLADLKRSSLELSIGYSAWPVVELVQAAREVIGASPRYVIAVSSDGGQVCHPGYDLAGASKSLLETLCRYLAVRLRAEGVRVNAIRPGFLDTASSRATFGDALFTAARAAIEERLLDPARVAKVCVALSSGLMDAVTGQVIDVDEGWSLMSPLSYLTTATDASRTAGSHGQDTDR